MDIITKARELGSLIATSKEMTVLKKCEELIAQDEKANRLFNEQKLIQKELVKAAEDNDSPESFEEIKKILAMKQEEIKNYSITADFIEAKTAFDKLMKTINDVIIFTITGEEPCSPSKCGSCGGCGN